MKSLGPVLVMAYLEKTFGLTGWSIGTVVLWFVCWCIADVYFNPPKFEKKEAICEKSSQ